MKNFGRFEDIEAWKKGRELTRRIYVCSRSGALRTDLGLCDQMRRASVSIQANIAEGVERDGRPEFLRFLNIAKGSAGELRSHLYVARDVGFLTEEQFEDLSGRAAEVARILAGLIDYLRKSG